MTTILLTVLFLILILILPVALTRRAVRQVIAIFKKNNALNPEQAKTIDELGLRPLTLGQRLLRARDYKPRAMKALIEAKIILATEDGRLYISEENLAKIETRK